MVTHQGWEITFGLYLSFKMTCAPTDGKGKIDSILGTMT